VRTADATRPGRLARLLPALDWLGHYRRDWLRGDLVAALTTWALVVPQAIAYAQIAQLPPQAGCSPPSPGCSAMPCSAARGS
jgi:hypothetical protein